MRPTNVLQDVATAVGWSLPVGAGLGLINAHLAERSRAASRAQLLEALDAAVRATPAATASFLLLSDVQHADWEALGSAAAETAAALKTPSPAAKQRVLDALAAFYKASRVEQLGGVPTAVTLAAAHGTLLRLAAGGGGGHVLPAPLATLSRTSTARNMATDTLKVVGVVAAVSAAVSAALSWAAESRRASSATAWTAGLPPHVAHTAPVQAAFATLAGVRGANLRLLRRAALRMDTLLALQAACWSGAPVPLEAGQSAAQLRASVDRHLTAYYDASGVAVLPSDGVPVDIDLAEAHGSLAGAAHDAAHNVRLKAQETLFGSGE